MDKKIVDEIIGRAATDADFRQQLIANPRKALTDAGYPIDEKFLSLLAPAHLQELDAMATEYENRFLGGKNIHDVLRGAPASPMAPAKASAPVNASAPGSPGGGSGGPGGGSGGPGGPGGPSGPPPMG